jgi:hypothetical protein
MYMYNVKTGERQEALAKHSTMLSLAEARWWVGFFKTNRSSWEYRYEKM